MTLTYHWNIASDNENSQRNFLSDHNLACDQYLTEKCSISALNNLSINRDEPLMTRSKTKSNKDSMFNTPSISNRQRKSIIRCSIDSFTNMTTTFTNSILFSKEELSDNRISNSPTDSVNKLADWFQSCSLYENKSSKNCLGSSLATDSHYMSSIISSTPNVKCVSNLYSTSQTSPLFGQKQSQLWSRFTTSTVENNLSIEQLSSTPSSNSLFSSLSKQIVPKTLSLSSLSKQSQIINSENLIKKEDKIIQSSSSSSSSKIFFSFILFTMGLVLGYLFTNTYPSHLIRATFFLIYQTSIEISITSSNLFYNYVEILLKYFSSVTLTYFSHY